MKNKKLFSVGDKVVCRDNNKISGIVRKVFVNDLSDDPEMMKYEGKNFIYEYLVETNNGKETFYENHILIKD